MASELPGIPVITGKNRFLSGDLAIRSFGSNLLILDDAFQHWALKRDFDIVLLNAAKPFGNGFLLPRGPLREPRQSLTRADAVILTGPGTNEAARCMEWLRQSLPGAAVLTARYRLKGLIRNGEVQPSHILKGKKVLAFCGLANPESFRNSLMEAGAQIISFLSYPDHFSYTRQEIEAVTEKARASGADLIISTEKDGVKLSAFPDFFRRVFLLKIDLEFAPDGVLAELIEDRITRWKKPGQRQSL